MIPTKVFTSHSSLDRVFTDSLVKVLLRHGIPVWYSPVNILVAQEWHNEIGQALDGCDWFLVVLSPNATKHPKESRWWVKHEVIHAINEARLEG